LRDEIMGKVSKEIKFMFIAILLLSGCSISVDQTTLDFGSMETEKTFYLEVKGALKWSIEADKDWVVVEPSEGSKSTSVKVTVKRTGLVEGAYESKLSVQTNSKVSTPIITVKMSVVSTPSIGQVLKLGFSFLLKVSMIMEKLLGMALTQTESTMALFTVMASSLNLVPPKGGMIM
jgi:hypothetical protein